MTKKEPTITGAENDWVSKRWRRLLCVFQNTSGLGKQVKRAINRRSRRRSKQHLTKGMTDAD